MVCINGGGPQSGFGTRVRLMANAVAKTGAEVTIMRFYPLLKSQGQWQTALPAAGGINIIEIPVLPMSRSRLLRALSFFAANIVLYLYAFFHKVDAIQAESTEAAYVVLRRRWLNLPVIVDYHGAAVEEARYARKTGEIRSAAIWQQAAERCSTRADVHLYVSTKLRDYMYARYPQSRQVPSLVVPINVDELFFTDRDGAAKRAELAIDARTPLLIYSGGDQRYQCLRAMFELFDRLAAVHRDLHFLVLSRNLEPFAKMAQQVLAADARRRVMMKSAKNKTDIAQYLAAADLAIMLRENEALNIVACPTKFGEYLAAGLPVVATPWAGHAPEFIDRYRVGTLVDPDKPQIEAVSALLGGSAPSRAEIRRVARAELHWSHCEALIERLYGGVLKMRKSTV